MAELISEDRDCPSKLVIIAAGCKEIEGQQKEIQRWQLISIELCSGHRMLCTGNTEETLLCRTPSDEIALLTKQIQQLLSGKRQKIYFEPSEPSFEISLMRTHRSGIRVEVWLDAGNGTTGIYTWDACGIRFMTTDDNLQEFARQLQESFNRL